MAPHCKALDTSDTEWSFCPSVGAACFLTICFGVTFVVHVVQGIVYKKSYAWVIAMGALWQTVAYIFRILSILNPVSLSEYAAWFVLILVAPLWTNAFCYMVLGRMAWNYSPNGRIWKITASRFGFYFVVLDIVAFIVQVYGAASAEGNDIPNSQVLKGLHTYMIGVGIQQLFILTFLVFALQLHRVIRRGQGLSYQTQSNALTLLYTVYAVLALITMRIVFRLCEYSKGLTSRIPNHEAYQYCLDTLPMLLAFILFNIIHPGRIMKGTDANILSRKVRKRTGVVSKISYQEGAPTEVRDDGIADEEAATSKA